MFSTWDHAQPGKWFGAAGRPQEQPDPLAKYLAVVDRLLYAATAAFLACAAVLIFR